VIVVTCLFVLAMPTASDMTDSEDSTIIATPDRKAAIPASDYLSESPLIWGHSGYHDIFREVAFASDGTILAVGAGDPSPEHTYQVTALASNGTHLWNRSIDGTRTDDWDQS
jgi:hypothetical protein